MKKLPTPEFYSALQAAYDHFNRELFGGRLPPVLLTVQRQPRMMGFVSSDRWTSTAGARVFELAINPEYFIGYSILEVFQTTCHEMTHIDQLLNGSPGRRGYHNQEWAEMMLKIGLVPSTTGRPGGNRTGESMNDYALIDGGFFRSAVRLINSGFVLPWLDRAPVINYAQYNIYTRKGEPVDFSNRPDLPLVLPLGMKSQYVAPRKSNDSSINNIAPPPYSSNSDDDALPEIEFSVDFNPGCESITVLPVSIERKQTRIKYVCKCKKEVGGPHAVWGKPKLNITCDDCKRPFKPEKKNVNTNDRSS